jgi:ubiquinone/menaquinone biosynthesis C-methylase UbiE
MNIYKNFAIVYSKGPYTQYSLWHADRLPRILRQFHANPSNILDIACGEGSFAIALAKRHYAVTGFDQSVNMLRIARGKARKQGAPVSFVKGDMRSIPFKEQFDLVTCWYDSLNYLLKQEDLRKTFAGVAKALRPGGIFIFDMNTEHALSVIWQEQPTRVQQDTSDIFEVHRPSYDPKLHVATLRITAFVRRNGRWNKMDEKHEERAYSLTQIRQCLKSAGLTELTRWGSIRKMTPPRKDSGRVWFIARRDDRSVAPRAAAG